MLLVTAAVPEGPESKFASTGKLTTPSSPELTFLSPYRGSGCSDAVRTADRPDKGLSTTARSHP